MQQRAAIGPAGADSRRTAAPPARVSHSLRWLGAVAVRLYEPFVSRQVSGMGLGLALSRQIVSNHDGRLWREALAPAGTRFIVKCPARQGGPA